MRTNTDKRSTSPGMPRRGTFRKSYTNVSTGIMPATVQDLAQRARAICILGREQLQGPALLPLTPFRRTQRRTPTHKAMAVSFAETSCKTLGRCVWLPAHQHCPDRCAAHSAVEMGHERRFCLVRVSSALPPLATEQRTSRTSQKGQTRN
jgi:hypothetical protein